MFFFFLVSVASTQGGADVAPYVLTANNLEFKLCGPQYVELIDAQGESSFIVDSSSAARAAISPALTRAARDPWVR